MSSPIRSTGASGETGSFGIGGVVRVAALMLLLAALVRPFALTPVRGVFVLLLDGFRLSVAERLAADGRLPVLGAFIAQSASGGLTAGAPTEAKNLFGSCRDQADAAEAPTMLWQELERQQRGAVLLHLRGGESEPLQHGLVIPGADEEAGFIGNDAGRVAFVRRIDEEGPPWPYSEMTGEQLEVVESLEVGAWSDWLQLTEHTPSGRKGLFRAKRIDQDRLYLTPVYRRFWKSEDLLEAAPEEYYVADAPSLPPVSSDDAVIEAMREHLRSLLRVRADLAVAAAATAPALLVFSDDILRRSEQLQGSSGENRRHRLPASADYEALDGVLGELIEAAGDAVAVVLIGRDPSPPAPEEAGSVGKLRGSYAIGGLGAYPLHRDVSVRVLASTLRRLLGLAFGPDRHCPAALPLPVTSVSRVTHAAPVTDVPRESPRVRSVEQRLLDSLR